MILAVKKRAVNTEVGLTSFTYQIQLKTKQILFSHYKMENLLKQFVKNTEPKISFSVVVRDNKTWFKTWFKPPIQTDKKIDYDVALMDLETYYSFAHIDRSNNCFSYSPGANAPWFNIIIFEKVIITLMILMSLFNEKLEKNSHHNKANDKGYMEISAKTNTLKSEMILKNNNDVDFRRYKSINNLLGFYSIL